MERIRRLGHYQKGILLFMLAMALVFAVVYPLTLAREGFAYRGALLLPHAEDGCTVYAGKIQGKPADFTVYEDRTVSFHYDGMTYGPYTAREDASALPADSELGDGMVGVELRCGEAILFRGGVLEHGDSLWLYQEDGTVENSGMTMTLDDGTVMDLYGNTIDPVEPSAATILELMGGPALTHRGEGLAWFGAVFICALNALSILFADELFRWNLKFQIRDADRAEPSDWELMGRYLSWTALALMALVIFIVGLQ